MTYVPTRSFVFRFFNITLLPFIFLIFLSNYSRNYCFFEALYSSLCPSRIQNLSLVVWLQNDEHNRLYDDQRGLPAQPEIQQDCAYVFELVSWGWGGRRRGWEVNDHLFGEDSNPCAEEQRADFHRRQAREAREHFLVLHRHCRDLHYYGWVGYQTHKTLKIISYRSKWKRLRLLYWNFNTQCFWCLALFLLYLSSLSFPFLSLPLFRIHLFTSSLTFFSLDVGWASEWCGGDSQVCQALSRSTFHTRPGSKRRVWVPY